MIVWYIDSIRGVAFPQFFFIGLQAAKFLIISTYIPLIMKLLISFHAHLHHAE